MRKSLSILLLAFLILSLVNVSQVIADEDELKKKIEELKEKEGEQKREVKIEVSDFKVEIESDLKKKEAEGKIENKFEAEFETKGKVEIKFEYKEKSKANETEMKTKLEQEFKFDSLIEFVDSNGNGLYDRGEEVSVYKLSEASFTPINYTTSITPNNVTDHVITTQTVDGVFKVVLHVVGDLAIIQKEIVKPTEIKIDIIISNYRFVNEMSKLALKIRIESVMEIKTEKVVGNKEEEVKVKSGNFTGFFSWKKTALVDGTEKPVLSTILAEDPKRGIKEIALIYERGNSIIHDPKIGVITSVADTDFTTTDQRTTGTEQTTQMTTGTGQTTQRTTEIGQTQTTQITTATGQTTQRTFIEETAKDSASTISPLLTYLFIAIILALSIGIVIFVKKVLVKK